MAHGARKPRLTDIAVDSVHVSKHSKHLNNYLSCISNLPQAARRQFAQMCMRSGILLFAILCVIGITALPAQAETDMCLACHGDKSMSVKRGGATVSLHVDGKKFSASVHGPVSCTGCHADLEGKDFPHSTPKKVNCSSCHSGEGEQFAKSMHGKAHARGDQLAPNCVNCHGNHDIVPVKQRDSAVYALKVPFVCGKCHSEGTPVQLNRNIDEHNIVANYTESMHGDALLRKGLVVAANCASCHTAHSILPHTDPNSSTNRRNIAKTCTKCHAGIESVHRKVIRGELWEKQANVLPACFDCHQPHKIRSPEYEVGMGNADCLRCHSKAGLKSADGRSMTVSQSEVLTSRHSKVACSQCHSDVNVSKTRPCETVKNKVDCTKCHEAVGLEYQKSIHGKLFAKGDPNAPICAECHGTHHILGKKDPQSVTYPTNVPNLCARCHREGQKAALRYTGVQHQIISELHREHSWQGLCKAD